MTQTSPLEQAAALAVKSEMTMKQAVQLFRRTFLVVALRENGNNQCQVARTFGVHRNTVRRCMQENHIILPRRGRR